jgi:signal transduction histidine kinase
MTQRFLNYLALELASTALQDKTDDDRLMTDASSSSKSIARIAKTIAEERERANDLVCQVDTIKVAVPQEHLDWIVSELVDNAFKFSQPTTTVTVRSESRDGRLHLWVTDQGQGMTHKQIASIGTFMQFERLAHEQQGAGLGLKIVQKAVELYGDRLLITSLYQQKTTVYLTLPLKSSNLQPEKLPPEAFEPLVLSEADA